MVFLRNPSPGKVKTRLAADVGPEKALEVYLKLVDHTLAVCHNAQAEVHLFYDQSLPEPAERMLGFHYHVQSNGDLGKRMFEAFRTVLSTGTDKAVIIGSDCAELTVDHVNEAFHKLDKKDAVVGPALDGGYYLLGLRKVHPALFTEKEWSTDTVLEQTMEDIHRLGWTFSTLKALRDIDTIDDLKEVRPDWL